MSGETIVPAEKRVLVFEEFDETGMPVCDLLLQLGFVPILVHEVHYALQGRRGAHVTCVPDMANKPGWWGTIDVSWSEFAFAVVDLSWPGAVLGRQLIEDMDIPCITTMSEQCSTAKGAVEIVTEAREAKADGNDESPDSSPEGDLLLGFLKDIEALLTRLKLHPESADYQDVLTRWGFLSQEGTPTLGGDEQSEQ